VTAMMNQKITIAAAVATTLASLALYPIFSGPSWFYSSTGAVIAVAIAGALTRIRRLSPVLCLLGGVIGLVLYLNLRFEAGQSLLLVIPTPGSLSALMHLVSQGMSDASAFAPPAPPTRGLLLLASAGVGFTAALVDLIAARFNSAAIAGLPLLMLFTEPFAINVSRGAAGTAIVFCLGSAGYLGLLTVDGRQRIRSWGRIAGAGFVRADTTALATTGRRVGLASVVVALCVPLLVPGLHAARLFQGTWTLGGPPGGSNQAITLPSPVTELRAALTEPAPQVVLTYRTNDPDPAGQYLQEYALSDLTSSGWELFNRAVRTYPVAPDLPDAPGLSRTATPNTEITTAFTFGHTVTADARSIVFLPMPYPSVSLNAPGSWLSDPLTLMTMARGVKLSGFAYQVTSLHLQPTSDELNSAPPAPASLAAETAVPSEYDALAPLAARITRGAKTELAKATDLQNYFSSTGGFTYTLDAPTVTDATSLATFLRSKRGYCEQFAFAMTVLARLSGIPARYAVGYTAGQRLPNGTWVVRTSDAHAWPELYFSNVGWLRFEPTPAGPGGQGTAIAPSYTAPPTISGTGGSGTTAQQPGHQANPKGSHGQYRPNAHIRDIVGPQGSGSLYPGLPRHSSSSSWALAGLAVLALLGLVLLVLLLPALIRITARPLRWRGTAEDPAAAARAGWAQFLADLADYRHAARPSESPRALAGRLTTELSLATPTAEAVRRLALAAERARYSAAPADPDGLREDVIAARRAVAASAGRRARWQARLVPASVIVPAAIAALRTLDRLQRLPRLLRKNRPAAEAA
jgi:transglutaminase-like putative cysteine protease